MSSYTPDKAATLWLTRHDGNGAACCCLCSSQQCRKHSITCGRHKLARGCAVLPLYSEKLWVVREAHECCNCCERPPQHNVMRVHPPGDETAGCDDQPAGDSVGTCRKVHAAGVHAPCHDKFVYSNRAEPCVLLLANALLNGCCNAGVAARACFVSALRTGAAWNRGVHLT